jgi:anhydro-N-acetylmuramic acid kinase
MSGTAADGADIAFASFTPVRGNIVCQVRGFFSVAYPRALRDRVLRVSEAREVGKEELCRLSMALGDFYAAALEKALAFLGIRPEEVTAVGCHGHSVGHFSAKRRGFLKDTGATLQIGEASFLAQRTGITAVSDFRPADMAAGGTGAPPVPAFHGVLLRGRGCFSSFQNLGGIGNVTVVSPQGKVVAAFDTGPGNLLIDGAVRRLSAGRKSMDKDGTWALRGCVREKFLAGLIRGDRFLALPPPKSTGRDRYGRPLLAKVIAAARKEGLSREDLLATLTAYTAETVRLAFDRYVLPKWPVKEIFLGGGGGKNPAIASALAERMPGLKIRAPETLGIPPQYVEAAAFAFLAYLALNRQAGNVPVATGGHPAILGKISPGRPR